MDNTMNNGSNKGLQPPIAYPGSKDYLASKILDILYAENKMGDDTQFYEVCCGSGAVSLSLVNKGFDPNNITMIDNSCIGEFWQSVANDEFDLNTFTSELDRVPIKDFKELKMYLENLSEQPVSYTDTLMIYHYLILQAGSYLGEPVSISDNAWQNVSFHDFQQPTNKRQYVVSPMKPMPDVMYQRVADIVYQLGGCIKAFRGDACEVLDRVDMDIKRGVKSIVVYINMPRKSTADCDIDIHDLVPKITALGKEVVVYVSGRCALSNADRTYMLSQAKCTAKRGNTGVQRFKEQGKPTIEEWLSKFIGVSKGGVE